MTMHINWEELERKALNGEIKHTLGDEWYVAMIRACKDLLALYNRQDVEYPTKITILDFVHQYPVTSRSDVLKLLEHAVIFSRLDLQATVETSDGMVYTLKLFQKGESQ